jgi:hypothetical protein
MRIINIIVATLMFTFFTNLKAESTYGFSIIGAQTEISGTETEGTATDTSTRSKTLKEVFVGGDIYAEYTSGGGYTIGLSYVPLDVEIGDGSRTDSSAGANVASEADTGTRTASAELTDLITAYANIPLGAGGWYGLLGVHMTTVDTSETLPNSKYGNEDIFGGQIGIGQRSGKFKYELSYSDFEDINISSSGGDNSNSVSADADALTFKMSFGF